MLNFAEMTVASVASKTVEEKCIMFDELKQTAVLWIADPKSRTINQYGYISVKAYDGKKANVSGLRGGRKVAAMSNYPQCVSLDWFVGDSISHDAEGTRPQFAIECLGYDGNDIRDQIIDEDAAGIKVKVTARITRNDSLRNDGSVVSYYNMKVISIKPIYDEEAELTPFTLDLTKAAPKDVFDDLKDAWKQVKQYGQYAHESTAEQSQLPV